MKLITAGRIYGAVGCLVLLGYFVAPPVVELSRLTCAPPLACPVHIAEDVIEVLTVAALYCVLAGVLISRLLDREPVTRGVTAAATFLVAVILFAAPLWLMLTAAFS